MKNWDELVSKAIAAQNVEPIKVTQEQHDALEALTVVYMEASKDSHGVPPEIVGLVMANLDVIWDKLVVVSEKGTKR